MRRVCATALFSLLAGCGVFDSVDPRVTELRQQRTKWIAQGHASYQFEYRRFCFCASVDWVRLTVINDAVAAAVRIDSGEQLPTGSFPTIDELFTNLEDALDQHYHRLDIAYDAVIGYPNRVDSDRSTNVADDEYSLMLRAFGTMPTGHAAAPATRR